MRAIKWWRNYKELKPRKGEKGLSSYAIELILAHLDIKKGVETSIEEGIIRFFQFLSTKGFPEISFREAINSIPFHYSPHIYVADDTNNENNAAKKVDITIWDEIVGEADDAFDALNIAQSKVLESDTVNEWKHVFGHSFNIN